MSQKTRRLSFVAAALSVVMLWLVLGSITADEDYDRIALIGLLFMLAACFGSAVGLYFLLNKGLAWTARTASLVMVAVAAFLNISAGAFPNSSTGDLVTQLVPLVGGLSLLMYAFKSHGEILQDWKYINETGAPELKNRVSTALINGVLGVVGVMISLHLDGEYYHAIAMFQALMFGIGAIGYGCALMSLKSNSDEEASYSWPLSLRLSESEVTG